MTRSETESTDREPSSLRRVLPLMGIAVVTAVILLLVAVFTADEEVETQGELTGDEEVETQGELTGIAFEAFGDGDPLELDALRGRPVLLNWWASWCLPCIEEMPEFQAVYEDVGDEVEFVGVNFQDASEQAVRLAEITGVRYRLVVDPGGTIFERLKLQGMPTTLFVDAEGEILERFAGQLDEGELRERLARHFGV